MLSEPDRHALMVFTLDVGDNAAAELLEVSVATLARAIAGLSIQRATRTHVLARFARARPAAKQPQPEPGLSTLDLTARRS